MLDPQFYRSALVVGREQIEKLRTKKVAVFGVGGVGSFAVEALARMGVGHLLLVDHDTIDVTNINRQLPATLETVGNYKTKVLQERIHTIHPGTTVETKEVFVLPDNLQEILSTQWDYLVDALDTVSAKIAIAEYGKKLGIPTISCMGTGNKLDPTKFQVADLYDTTTCPLCRVLRRELRKREVFSLKVVYSTEEPRSPKYEDLPIAVQQQMREESPNGRCSTPGSVSFVPPVAGMIAAGEVIKDLLEMEG